MCLSVCLSQVFLTGSKIGQSQRQTAAMCVRPSVCVCVSSGFTACRSIDLKLLLWSLAFVCQIYLSCRLSLRCHSLTHGSDTSWELHRWENNTYLWPLELFLLSKAPEKECFSCPRLFKCLPGDMAIETKGVRERHFKTGIDLQLVSGMGIEQNSWGFIAYTLHVLCMDLQRAQTNRQCCQQFSAWLFTMSSVQC